MNSEVIKLLRDTANNFAQLAEALEQEQKNTSKRIDYLEMTVHETKNTMRAAADLILRQL
jgi:hypothetical protein